MTKDLADELERLAKDDESDNFYRRRVARDTIARLVIAELPQIISALRREEWQGIETAPKGDPGPEVGTREASEWFLGFSRGRLTLTVRRRAWPQDDHWEDRSGVRYAPSAFTHWRPLPPPPKGTDHE